MKITDFHYINNFFLCYYRIEILKYRINTIKNHNIPY